MSFLPSQGVSPSSLFGVCGMKVLGLGSELSGGKVSQITKNGLTITKPDGKIEVISLTEAERRVWVRV